MGGVPIAKDNSSYTIPVRMQSWWNSLSLMGGQTDLSYMYLERARLIWWHLRRITHAIEPWFEVSGPQIAAKARPFKRVNTVA